MIFNSEPPYLLTAQAKRYLERQISNDVAAYVVKNPVVLYCQTRSAHAHICRERNVDASNGWQITAHCMTLFTVKQKNVWFCSEKPTPYRGTSGWGLTAARALKGYFADVSKGADTDFGLDKKGKVIADGDPSIDIQDAGIHQLRRLQSWFATNSAQLNLNEEMATPDFLTRCIEVMNDAGAGARFLSNFPLSIDFVQGKSKRFGFHAPIGIDDDIIYPITIGAPLPPNVKRIQANAHSGSPWTCYISVRGYDFVGNPSHYYRANGLSPLDALHEASLLARDPVKVAASGNIRLGSGPKGLWRFSPEEVNWRHSYDRCPDQSFGSFEPYLRNQIWEKAQAHPRIANLILLDAALR